MFCGYRDVDDDLFLGVRCEPPQTVGLSSITSSLDVSSSTELRATTSLTPVRLLYLDSVVLTQHSVSNLSRLRGYRGLHLHRVASLTINKETE